MDIHYFCQILFSTKSKTFNVIFFHESFNVLSILRVKTVFYSSDGFFLKIVELLNPICFGTWVISSVTPLGQQVNCDKVIHLFTGMC